MAKMILTVFQILKDLQILNLIWAVLTTDGVISVTIHLFGQIMVITVHLSAYILLTTLIHGTPIIQDIIMD
ncbi:MAG: hypothetical protein QF370_04795 [Candidatus Marinimicrobia bacterium]|nr:hypothetical protein [Candidatus Neomarinimicrobiota bacterium]